jgi:hypothetical protein
MVGDELMDRIVVISKGRTCEYGHPGPHRRGVCAECKRLDAEIEREIAATSVDWSKYRFTDEEFEKFFGYKREIAYPLLHESEEKKHYNRWRNNDSPEAQRQRLVRQADTTRLSKDDWNWRGGSSTPA